MALAGINVVSGFAGFDGFNDSNQSLFGNAEWSENLTTPALSVKTARSSGKSPNFGKPVFRFYAVADSYVTVGKTPVLATGPKHFLKAGEFYDIVVADGDTYVWGLA
jgi:hypothetical protein